jgi:hypothetical protein
VLGYVLTGASGAAVAQGEVPIRSGLATSVSSDTRPEMFARTRQKEASRLQRKSMTETMNEILMAPAERLPTSTWARPVALDDLPGEQLQESDADIHVREAQEARQ